MTTSRRSFLRAAVAAPALGGLAGSALTTGGLAAGGLAAEGLGRSARAADPLHIGFVYVAPIGDAGWTYQHELGRRAMDAALGDKVKSIYVEDVAEGADAERVIRKLATDGNKLIFTTSFGYMNPTLRVAQQFPAIKFEHATGYKRAANVATYSARFYEGRYLCGLIAGRMSKTGVIGYVAAFPIPEVLQGINATLLAAQSVNPKATIKVVWTSSWFDPGKERAAADTLIAQGADIITNHTDSTAVTQAGEEKGVYTLSYNSDMQKYGPKTCLTGTMMVWDQYYINGAKAVLDNTWVSHDTWGGVKEGMIKLAPFNKAIPETVLKEVADRQSAIAAGTLKPFSGPIKDQSGKVVVADGHSMTDPEILGMKFFIQGVQGKV